MRVLFLGPFPPPFGGVQTHLVGLREYLRSRGVESAVINITGTRRDDADGVYYPRTATQVMRLLWRVPADVIHLHLGGDLTRRLQALLLVCSAIPGRRAVLTFHSGGYPASPAGRRARPRSLRGFILRRLDALIAVNAELAQLFRRFGVPERRVHLIPPFAAPATQAGSALPPEVARFADAHDPLLISVGLLEPEYDLPLQVRAIGALRGRHPAAGLLIVGSGSQEASLRALVASQPHAEHVLVAGDVPHPATLTAIARARALLRTTTYDGDAMSVREALHLGTPVIATDNGMRPAGVRLFDVGDLDGLLREIDAVLSGESRTPGAQNADGAENLEAVLQLYHRVVAG